MICNECRYAADLVAAYRGSSYEKVAMGEAVRVHARCPGCDCQHDVAAQAAGKAVEG